MQQAHLIVFESDGKLAAALKEPAREHGFPVRQVRQEKACLSLLRRSGAGVLVLKLGRDLEREMALLERVTWLFPDTATVVVGDTNYPGLAGLAWDLGARFVLFPPCSRDLLPELVVRLMPGPMVKSP